MLATTEHQQEASSKTTQQTKANVLTMLIGSEKASEIARQKVSQAGVPAVDDGEQIAGRLISSLAKQRDAYATARMTVEQLPVDRIGDFDNGVYDAIKTLQATRAAHTFDVDNVGEDELQRAFNDIPECI